MLSEAGLESRHRSDTCTAISPKAVSVGTLGSPSDDDNAWVTPPLNLDPPPAERPRHSTTVLFDQPPCRAS